MRTEGIFLVQFQTKIVKSTSEKKTFVRTLREIEVPDSLSEMFKNAEALISNLGSDLSQVYYTLGKTKAETDYKRHFISQDVILIDVDHIIRERINEYIPIVLEEFNATVDKTIVIDSGYGLQFILQFQTPVTDKKEFDILRPAFLDRARSIEVGLEEAGLIQEVTMHDGVIKKTSVDRSVFRDNSLARMPGTLNNAPEKKREARPAIMLHGNLEPQALTLGALIGSGGAHDLKDLERSNSTSLKVDKETVKRECNFLNWALTSPGEVHEEQFYLASGLLKELAPDGEDGVEYTLGFWEKVKESGGSPTVAAYTRGKAERKILSSKGAACAAIGTRGDWCKTCPHAGKVTHPAQIKGKGFIATKNTGFRLPGKKGPGPVDHRGLKTHFIEQEGVIISNEKEPKKTLYHWNKNIYAPLHPAWVQKFALDHVYPRPNESERGEFLTEVAMDNMVSMEDVFFKRTEGKINFANGVLDIDSGVLEEPSPERGFTYALECDYDKDATPTEFLKCMGEWMQGVEENIPILQMYAGYVLAGGAAKSAKVLILTGHGRNGKSTYGEIIDGLLGGAKSDGASIAMSAESFAKSHMMAELQTKALAIIDEQKPNLPAGFWEEIKRLSAGGKVSADKKFKDTTTFYNRAKFIIIVNDLSSGTAHTEGFLSRLLIVNFPHFIPPERRDSGLVERLLKNEAAGIANWAIEGFRMLRDQYKFQFPETIAMTRALDEYQEETNMVYAFCKEYGIELGDPCEQGFAVGDLGLHKTTGDVSGIWADELYNLYVTFLEKQFHGDHFRKVESKTRFSKKMSQHFKGAMRVVVAKRSAASVRVYSGVRARGAASDLNSTT